MYRDPSPLVSRHAAANICRRHAPLVARLLAGLLAGFCAASILAAGYANGRFAYTFDGKEFPDARSACAALLTKDRDVPQTVSRAGPAQENGDAFYVPCTGKLPDGSIGYDQEGTAVGYELICPENSREAHPDKVPVRSTQRCACNDGFEPRGNQCVKPGEAVARGAGTTAGSAGAARPAQPAPAQPPQQPPASPPTGSATAPDAGSPPGPHAREMLNQLAPHKATVRLVATLKLAAGQAAQSLVAPTSKTEQRKVSDAAGQPVQLPVSALPLTAAQTRSGQANGGGCYVVPSPGAGFVQVVAWNTSDPKEDSNASHAEEQLANWLLGQRKLRAQVVDVSIQIDRSPCALCTARTLCPLVEQLRKEQPALTASLSFDRLHAGRNATTEEDLGRLRNDCRWNVGRTEKPARAKTP